MVHTGYKSEAPDALLPGPLQPTSPFATPHLPHFSTHHAAVVRPTSLWAEVLVTLSSHPGSLGFFLLSFFFLLFPGVLGCCCPKSPGLPLLSAWLRSVLAALWEGKGGGGGGWGGRGRGKELAQPS